MRSTLWLLGSAFLAIQACGSAEAQEPALFGYPFPLSRTAGSGSGDDFAPQLATDGQGTWVAVWDSFDSLDGSIGTDGDILVARSIDGYTWSEPAGLDPNAGSDAEDDVFSQLTTDGLGTWVAVWHSFDALGGTIEADGDILVSRSTDAGVTWSAAAALDPNAGSDTGDDLFPQLTTDGLGTWVAVWDSDDSLGGPIGTDGDILVSRSTDGGVTWSAAAALDPNAGSDAGDDFSPRVTTDGLGTWVAVWDSTDALGGPIGTDGDILVSRSTNGGATWSAAAALDPNADSDSGDDLFAQLTTDGQGVWVAVWHSFDRLGWTIGTDGDILVSRSTDGGVTWSAAAALHANAGTDVGDDLFPQLATDRQGTWIATWDSADELGPYIGAIGTDGDILAARSVDGGVTWGAAAALNPNAGGDVGGDFSPQLATDGQGTWVAVWESSDTLGGTLGPDNDILGAVLDPGIYEDTNSSGSFDPGEERAGGVGGNEGSIFDYVFDLDASTHDLSLTSIELVMETYNHAFRIDINGTTVVPLDPGNPAVFTPAIDDPDKANENGLPNLRVAITEVSIEFAGSENERATSITTPVLYNQPTTPPVFVDGQNTVRIENPDGRGLDGIDFRIRLRRGEIPYQKISDTQGGFTGGIPDRRTFTNWLASLGDLNGDGVGDLVQHVGQHSDPEGDGGGIWILFLNADGTVNAHQRISATEGGFTGEDVQGGSVTSLGDFDGDGVIDLVMGTHGDDDGGTRRGAVWVLFLNPNGTVKSQQKISSTQGGFTGALDDDDGFGRSVTSLGDLDGDGVGDLAVGAPRDDDGGTDHGAVWVLFLNVDGTVKSHQKVSGTQGGFTGALDDWDNFGWSVASLDDLDGDGVGDLAVGAYADDDGGSNSGAAWVLFLDTDGTVESHQKISSTQGGFTGAVNNADYFGFDVASLDDLDGDGVGDLAVGAWGDDDGGLTRGAVWLLFLNADGTVKSHEKISSTRGGVTGTLDDGDRFGTAVASLGDLSGNGGVGDLAVNAWSDDDGGPDHGAVWILFLDGAFCSDEIRNSEEQCDDGNLADGDGCDHTCQIEVEDSWEFTGTAAGGTVSLSVEGFPLQVLTFAGETAAGVAANIADAINADPTLSTLGVFAFASENTVIVNGMISDRLIDDPGLNPTAVPALGGSRLALLAALLGIMATMEVRSRARARA